MNTCDISSLQVDSFNVNLCQSTFWISNYCTEYDISWLNACIIMGCITIYDNFCSLTLMVFITMYGTITWYFANDTELVYWCHLLEKIWYWYYILVVYWSLMDASKFFKKYSYWKLFYAYSSNKTNPNWWCIAKISNVPLCLSGPIYPQ